MTLREQLLELSEPGYQKFISPLMPGVENVLGIRIPLLRKIAREIARGDWREYLTQSQEFYFEERMLQGLIVSYAQCTPDEKLRHVARFVPKIDNWAVCDCFCWRLETSEREPMWAFLQPYFRSTAPYEIRFAVVMALGNFIDEEHLEALLELLGSIRHDHYYVRMGVAWAVSMCCVKFPERTVRWLEEGFLDDWTHNKSIQKACESYRVDPADKTSLRTLRRKTKRKKPTIV